MAEQAPAWQRHQRLCGKVGATEVGSRQCLLQSPTVGGRGRAPWQPHLPKHMFAARKALRPADGQGLVAASICTMQVPWPAAPAGFNSQHNRRAWWQLAGA